MNSPKFNHEELKRRKCRLISTLLSEVHEEEIGIHTRVAEMIIWDAWTTIGRSSKASTYREHVVPLAYLTKTSLNMFSKGKTVEDVEQFWFDYYQIAFITKEEAKLLNSTEGLKTGMPKGWNVGDDIRQRLWAVGIHLDTDQVEREAS